MKKLFPLLLLSLFVQVYAQRGVSEPIIYSFSTLAGSEKGFLDGPADEAQFNAPKGIAVYLYGNIYVNEYWNNCVRKVSAEGLVTTLAGKVGEFGATDGPGELPSLTVDFFKNLIVRNINPYG